jgi:hypothetical protein
VRNNCATTRKLRNKEMGVVGSETAKIFYKKIPRATTAQQLVVLLRIKKGLS